MQQAGRVSNAAKMISLFFFFGLVLADAVVGFVIMRERILPQLKATGPTTLFFPAVLRAEELPTPTAESITATPEVKTYSIQSGDTLFSIAQKFGISVDDLAKANQIDDVNMIYAGEKLTIPLPAVTSTPTPKP